MSDSNHQVRQPRSINDTVVVLANKLAVELARIPDGKVVVRLDDMSKLIVNDDQPARLAMLKLWLQAREIARNAAKKVEAESAALADYQACIAPVVEGWKAANFAWTYYVVAEAMKGHDGQKAIAQGTRSIPGLWLKFAEMEAKVKAVRGNDEMVAALAAELADLTEEATNFYVPNWCKHEGCGAPIEATLTPKDGGKPFPISFCFAHVSDKDIKPAGKKNGKPMIVAEPLSPEEIEKRRIEARQTNEANLKAKKDRRRQGAEASAEASQAEYGNFKTDGGAKSIRKHEKEMRAQGDHPEGKKKGGKKKGG